ncbi:MAG: hypothetical protein JO056_04220 [Alphaproteobacteria bacterium]|nr:hypothetical protein [Alphaproteobacteria bacterium]
MPVVHLLGYVSPTNLQIGFKLPLHVDVTNPFSGKLYDIRPEIRDCKIDVSCQMDEFILADFQDIFPLALDIVSNVVNLIAFATGWGLTVILDKFVDPDGNEKTIRHRTEYVQGLCTSYGIDKSRFSAVLQMLHKQPSLGWAFEDLARAIRETNTKTVHCARAIETLKHLVADENLNNTKRWEQFRDKLNLTVEYVKILTDYSAENRHGKRVFVSAEITQETMRRAWIIMDRYIAFRLHGGIAPLPLSQFPML